MNRPRGIGLWVAFLGMVEGGDWGRMRERLQQHAIGWLAVRSGGTRRAISSAQLAAWRALASSVGARLYTWHYSYPSALSAQVDHVASLVAEGVDGHVIDAEAEWQRSSAKADTRPLAQAFGQSLRGRIGSDVYLAHAPLGIEDLHADFPYLEFGRFCNDVMPQAYWTEFGWSYAATVSRVDMDYEALRRAHPEQPACCPVGVTYGKGARLGAAPGQLTADDVAAYVRRYPGVPISFYSWENAQPAFWAGLLAASGQPIEPAHVDVSTTIAVQRVLAKIARAVRIPAIDPGPLDGIWGPLTQHGLEAFERYAGLAVGPITPAVRAALQAVYERAVGQ